MSTSPEKGLTLVLGPANAGKLGFALDWWQERLAAKPLVVVPTAPDARSLSTEMAQRVGALVGRSPAVTFDGLVRLLLRRSPRYAGDLERSVLISYLLHESPPRAPGFSTRFPGMVGAAESLLAQLGDSGLPVEQIECLLERWGATDQTGSLLAADLRGLLLRYRVLRDRLGMTDRSDSVREALASSREWTQPLVLYGFTSFTLAQRRLVATLAENIEVLLVLDFERSRSRSLTTVGELSYWEAIAARALELETEALAYDSPAIAYLERHFMDDGPLPEHPAALSDGEGVRFLLAAGQRSEAELAAEQVAELIRKGVSPGSIAVVVRHMKTWGGLLKDVLTSCGIPCEVDQRRSLEETGLGHAFLVGLRGAADDDPEALLGYLRSPFSGLSPEETSDLQTDYLRQTARGVRALLGCARAGSQAAIGELLGVIVQREGRTLVDLDAARALARHMLENALRRPVADAEGSAETAEDARAFRALHTGLSDLATHRASDLLPIGALDPAVLLPALSRMTAPGGALGSEDAVQVLTAHRARARRFQAVLVLGLVEGEFPARTEKSALLTRAQRSRLDMLAGGLFPPEADEEEALFIRAVSRAWRFLFLSSRDADDGGGYAGQSYYWLHCKALLGVGEREHVHRTLADLVFEPAIAPTPRQYLRACAARSLDPHPAFGPAPLLSRRWRLRAAQPALASRRVLGELAGTPSFSPSALESYLTCPFIWFVEKVVGVEDLETVLDKQFVGQLLHKVLSETYLELRSANVLPLRAQDVPFAEGVAGPIVEALVDSDECPGTPSERRLVEYQLKRMVADLFAMETAAGSAWLLADTELTVGGTDGVDVGGVAIRGRIDRVDTAPTGDLFVIDYKSGSLPDKAKIGTAEGLQLPLYMLALAGERSDRRVIGGAYISPRKRERAGVARDGCDGVLQPQARAFRVMGDEEWREMLEGTIILAREAAKGIRSGRIAPRTDRRCPDWCRLGPVCRTRSGGGQRRR